jgi:hypothetical protein
MLLPSSHLQKIGLSITIEMFWRSVVSMEQFLQEIMTNLYNQNRFAFSFLFIYRNCSRLLTGIIDIAFCLAVLIIKAIATCLKEGFQPMWEDPCNENGGKW